MMVLNEIVLEMQRESTSRWNGGYKSFTKDCEECVWHRKAPVECHTRTIKHYKIYVEKKDGERCHFGVAWKYLVRDPSKPLRKCQYRGKPLKEVQEKAENL